MNPTTTTTAARARASTAVLLMAATVLASTSFATGIAHAQDPAGTPAQVQVQTQPAANGPPPGQPPPQLAYAPREDGPRVITDWREGEPIPRGYHPAQRTRKAPIIAGAVTFGVLYMLTAFTAAVATDIANASQSGKPTTALFVPVIGPFLTIPQSSTATGDFFLVLDGIGQTTGVILLIWGLASPQTLLMKDGYARPRLLPQPILLGKSGGGFGLSGSF